MDSGIIAVWGRNGSGKSTLAAMIAAAIAKRDKIVGVISADTSYSSILHILGVNALKEKSLGAALADLDDEAARYFTECPKIKNLFVLALSEQDNCFTIGAADEKDITKLLLVTRERFDYLIIDCTANIRDAITFLGMYHANRIVEVMRASVVNYKYRLSHQIFLDDFNFGEKTLSIINCDMGYLDVPRTEKALKIKFFCSLPYCETIIEAENNGEILSAGNVRTRRDGKFIKGVNALAYELTN